MRHLLSVGFIAAVVVAASLAVPVRSVSANTVVLSDGSGWGDLYRNNYRSSGCHLAYGSQGACYEGTWGATHLYPCVCSSWV